MQLGQLSAPFAEAWDFYMSAVEAIEQQVGKLFQRKKSAMEPILKKLSTIVSSLFQNLVHRQGNIPEHNH